MNMKNALFITFLAVYGATAVITLLGIAEIREIDSAYLSKLFYVLIVETVVAVIALFKVLVFPGSDSSSSRVNVVMLPKDSFPRSSDPHQCTVTIYNAETDEEQELQLSTVRSNGHLSAFLDNVNEKELIRIAVKNSRNEAWESEFFTPSLAKAEMVKL
jgi:hypothetical protein